MSANCSEPDIGTSHCCSLAIWTEDVFAGVLNSGHTRGTASVLRCVGEKFDTQEFSSWVPVVIARIGELSAALKTRCIEIKMRRARADETIERPTPIVATKLAKLRTGCESWAVQHADELRNAHPEPAMGCGKRVLSGTVPGPFSYPGDVL